MLLGASHYLTRKLPAATVDAQVGRQGNAGLKIMQGLRDQAKLGDATVVHLGTNGFLVEKQLKALLQHLSDRKIVVLVNVFGARRWTGPNNALIARLSPQFDNVRVLDWHALGQANPDYFVKDGIHLSGSGIHAYYNQIRMALGQPEVMASGPALRHIKRPQLPKSHESTAATPSDAVSGPTPDGVQPGPKVDDLAPAAPID